MDENTGPRILSRHTLRFGALTLGVDRFLGRFGDIEWFVFEIDGEGDATRCLCQGSITDAKEAIREASLAERLRAQFLPGSAR